mgnify:FL=1
MKQVCLNMHKIIFDYLCGGNIYAKYIESIISLWYNIFVPKTQTL